MSIRPRLSRVVAPLSKRAGNANIVMAFNLCLSPSCLNLCGCPSGLFGFDTKYVEKYGMRQSNSPRNMHADWNAGWEKVLGFPEDVVPTTVISC